jgi:hypothetical protein
MTSSRLRSRRAWSALSNGVAVAVAHAATAARDRNKRDIGFRTFSTNGLDAGSVARRALAEHRRTARAFGRPLRTDASEWTYPAL